MATGGLDTVYTKIVNTAQENGEDIKINASEIALIDTTGHYDSGEGCYPYETLDTIISSIKEDISSLSSTTSLTFDTIETVEEE